MVWQICWDGIAFAASLLKIPTILRSITTMINSIRDNTLSTNGSDINYHQINQSKSPTNASSIPEQETPGTVDNQSFSSDSFERPASAMMDSMIAFASFQNRTKTATASATKANSPADVLRKTIGDKGELSQKTQPPNPEAVKALQKQL